MGATIFLALHGERISSVMSGIPGEMTVNQYVANRCRACGVVAKIDADKTCLVCSGITAPVQP